MKQLHFHKNLEFYENSLCFSSNYNCINSIKHTKCEIQTLFVIYVVIYALNKFSYFVMRVCGCRLQHFLEMWPSMQKVCSPLV